MSLNPYLYKVNTYRTTEDVMVVKGLHINMIIDKINEINEYSGFVTESMDKVSSLNYTPSQVGYAEIMRGIHLREIITELNRIITDDNLPIDLLETDLIYKDDFKTQNDTVIVRNSTLREVILKTQTLSTTSYWTVLTSGLIVYRKGIRDLRYVIDYSDDGGVTWELDLVKLVPTEDNIIINIDHGVVGYRHEIRGNDYYIDKELTPAGFSGVENIDWEYIYRINK